MALAYTAPTWIDGSGQGISADQLQAISNCIEGLVQGSDKAIHDIAINGSTITVTFADGSIQTRTSQNIKSIHSITKTSSSGLVDTHTILYTDGGTSSFTVTNGADGPQGPQGPQGIQGVPGANGTDGEDGVSVTRVTLISTVGKVKTYRISFSDGSHFDYEVTDGSDGADGRDGTNGQDGADGENGADGISVTGVVLLSTSGKVKTYRMSFSNGSYFDYQVTDGADGEGAGDMLKSVYDTDNDGVVDSAETLKGLTASVTELNYMDGVTSSVQTQLNNKVNNVSGKGLSTEDYTTAEKNKLNGIASGAEVNVINSADSNFSVSNKVLSLASQVTSKLSEIANKADANNVYTKTEINTQLNGKANTSSLDGWTSAVTLASGNTVTFTGLNDSYGYKLFCVNNPNAIQTNCVKTGSGTSMQLVYTVSGDGLQVGITQFKLRIVK